MLEKHISVSHILGPHVTQNLQDYRLVTNIPDAENNIYRIKILKIYKVFLENNTLKILLQLFKSIGGLQSLTSCVYTSLCLNY